MGNQSLYENQVLSCLENSVQSWWVPQLPFVLPECPSGFMYVAIACCESEEEDVPRNEQETYVGVPSLVMSDIVENLPVLKSGFFLDCG